MTPRRRKHEKVPCRNAGENIPLLPQRGLSWLDILRFCRPYIVPPDTRHRFLALASLSSIVLAKVFALAPPLILSNVVDHIADGGQGSLERTFWALSLFFAASAGGVALSALQRITNGIVACDARRRFSVDLYQHLIRLSMSYHLKQRSGEVMSIMTRSTTSVTTITNLFVFQIVPTLFETFLVILVFFRLGKPSIAVAVLLSVVFYFVFTYSVTPWTAETRREQNEAENDLSGKTHETLSNLESVKVFQKDEHEAVDYNERAILYRDTSVDMITSLEVLNSGQDIIRILGLFTGLCIAAYGTLYGNPRVTPGVFVSINLLIIQLFQV